VQARSGVERIAYADRYDECSERRTIFLRMGFMPKMNRRMQSIAAGAMLLCVFASAHAQTHARFPMKPIRIVVPYPAGGPTDMTARTISPRMIEALGQQMVIDNRAGASTIIGTEIVARAPPDGHTLLLVTSTISMNPSVFRKLPYDVERDLVPVTQVIASPFALLAHPALPVRSTADLLALIKARPGQLLYPSSGVGSANHLAVVLLARLSRVEPAHVPYKGTAQGIADLVAGHVQFSLNNPLTSLPLANAGKLRLLATTGARRLALLPAVPTVSETVPGYEAGNWHALFAPGGTPREVVARLQAEVARALAAPEARSKLVEGGADPVGSSPDEFAAYFKSELAKWAQTVKTAKIQVE